MLLESHSLAVDGRRIRVGVAQTNLTAMDPDEPQEREQDNYEATVALSLFVDSTSYFSE